MRSAIGFLSKDGKINGDANGTGVWMTKGEGRGKESQRGRKAKSGGIEKTRKTVKKRSGTAHILVQLLDEFTHRTPSWKPRRRKIEN